MNMYDEYNHTFFYVTITFSFLMDTSFAMRWEDIHENPCSIEVILDKYPFLQTSDQV